MKKAVNLQKLMVMDHSWSFEYGAHTPASVLYQLCLYIVWLMQKTAFSMHHSYVMSQ